MKAELEIKNFLMAINEFRTPEQQPGGVQVVEWVGLVRDKELAENLKTFIHECWPILRPDSFIITVQH